MKVILKVCTLVDVFAANTHITSTGLNSVSSPFKKNYFTLKFTEFGFDPRLMEGIESSGYQDATPVQEQVIPLIMAGKDVIASAQTGTGKTAAFLLPLINKIITDPHEDHTNNALVIVPTRELAVQIAQHMEGLSYFTSVS